MIPTSTDVTLTAASKLPRTGAIVLLADEKGKLLGGAEAAPKEHREAARAMLKDGTLSGKPGEVGVDMVAGRRVIVIGVGKGEVDRLRDAGAIAAKQGRRFKQEEIAIVAPSASMAEAIACGFGLGAFEYREYRGSASKQKEAEGVRKFRVSIVGGEKQAVARGEAVAFGQNYARTIASRPGNDINPPSLAKEAQRLAKEMGLNVRVLDDGQLRKLGMGGLIGVGQGSGKPPRMIAIEYGLGGAGKGTKARRHEGTKGRKKAGGSVAPLLVVGKAITFDTGGISIKPAQGMGSMIYDKCGGMAVLGLMAAVARLKVDRPVVGLLAAAENMPGPDAYRPGDILKMYNGVTVEVTNTDAEGRLVLADALTWGIETYQPAACVNLATLTGACVVALGVTRAGAWSNNDGLWQALSAAAERAGEKIWRMPLGDDYRDMLKATSADIVNSPGRNGGSNTAAEFLHHFIPGNLDGKAEVPWCHLDIAGVADTEKDTPLYAKGATGFGVRTLVEWVTGT